MIPSLAGFIFLFPASRPLPRFNLMEVVELERLCVMNRPVQPDGSTQSQLQS